MADNILIDNGGNADYTVKSTDQGSGVQIQHVRMDLEAVYTQLVEDAGTYTYIGWAAPGTATSSASWRIARVENSSGSKLWADGNGAFDNVWDDRASLTY